jgi:hypothetical protein
MSKQSGLGDNFYLTGVDISGDTASLSSIHGGTATQQDVTDITQSGVARLGLERDGGMSFGVYFDATGAHPSLSALPTTDVVASYFRGATVGNAAASLVSKQINYDWTRGQDGSLLGSVDLQANGFGLEWGTQLTAGKRTDSGATVGSFFDNTAGFNFGAQAYVQLFAFSGTSVTIDIQSATTSGGSYTTTGLTTSALTSAPQAVRLSVANNTTINEFLKVVTTGTFSNAVFAVMINVNPIAGVVF